MGIITPIKIMSPPVSSSASQATAEQGLEEMLDKVKKLEVPSAEVVFRGLGVSGPFEHPKTTITLW